MKRIILCVTILLLASGGKAQWLLSNNGLLTNSQLSWKIYTIDNNMAVISYGSYSVNKLAITTNGGTSWQHINTPSTTEVIIDLFCFSSNSICAATDMGKIYKTTDSGSSWSLVYSNNQETTFLNYIKFFDSQNGIAVGDAINANTPLIVLKTTNAGDNWVNVNTSNLIGAVSFNIYHTISFVNSQLGFYRHSNYNTSNDRKLYKTTDGGSSWDVVSSLNANNFALVEFYNSEIGICVSSQTPLVIYRTFDGGATWSQIQTTITKLVSDVAFILGDPSKLWMATIENLFFSSDTGKTWNEQVVTPAPYYFRDIEFSDVTTGWLLADWGKVFRSTNADKITSVKNEKLFLSDFKLLQNYPNPFNPGTVIKFLIPNVETGHAPSLQVFLKVYDILGNEVATLVNEEKSAGVYKVEFDASKLPNGVYFYQLRVDQFIETKKMILLR